MIKDNKIAYKSGEKLVGIIVLEAILTNTSPLQIGSGRDEESDKEIIRKPAGKPYIPASALAGKLLRLFKKHQNIEDSEVFKQFWGGEIDKKHYQSHLSFDDADMISDSPRIVVRDGVKIESTTNLAKNKGKFDYEVLEPNHQFKFRAEIKIRKNFDLETFKKYGDLMKNLLKSFQIGASEKSGFGLMKSESSEAYYFDFTQDKQADIWFEYLEGNRENLKKLVVTEPISLKSDNLFTLKATFALKSTLLTATYGTTKDEPDKVQLSRNNGTKKEYILSGAAIRGALKHRAERILKIRGKSTEILDTLFGFVLKKDEIKNPNDPKARKSKLRIHESVFTKDSTLNQTRIKIDRFTGGTIEGALLESQPITCSEGQQIELNFSIPDFEKNEVELMLYLLKDLWNEDLPIGGDKNVGRGLLIGKKAILTFFDEKEEIIIDENGISENHLAILNKHLPCKIK